MAAYPHASPAPALLTRRVVRLALGASALVGGHGRAGTARRSRAAPAVRCGLGLDRGRRSALNLASVAGKAIVWKAALDALPGQRPARYGHVVPARCSSASCSTPCSSPAWARSRASRCSDGAGGSRGRADPGEHDRRHGDRRAAGARRRAGAVRRRARAGAPPAAHDLAARDRVPCARSCVVIGRADGRDAQGARSPGGSRRGPLARSGAVPQAARDRARDGRGHDLLGRADRRHLGRTRGLPHPRRTGRRRPRLRLLHDRPAVPVLARQPRHLPTRRRRTSSSASTPSRPPTPSPSASACNSSKASSASASDSSSSPAKASP